MPSDGKLCGCKEMTPLAVFKAFVRAGPLPSAALNKAVIPADTSHGGDFYARNEKSVYRS
jgi:hypothetical protein